jgi:hypothetical protein
MEAKLAFRIAGGAVALGVIIIGLSAFAGGATTATVSGRVTMSGRPVIWGAVILVGPDGRSVAGRIQPDGSYTVPDAPIGDVAVAVTSPDPLVDHYKTQIRSARKALPVAQWPAPPVDRQQWFVLPKHYEDPKTSDLKLTVNRGRNEFDLTLAP